MHTQVDLTEFEDAIKTTLFQKLVITKGTEDEYQSWDCF